MRFVLLLVTLLIGCTSPGPAPAPGAEPDAPEALWEGLLPDVTITGGGAAANWTFSANLANPTGRVIWLGQRSCEVGAGVTISNTTGPVGGSHPPGIACGYGGPHPLAENETLRFTWTWNGTVHEGARHAPAPAGTYTFEVWVAWNDTPNREGPYRQHASRFLVNWAD